MVGCRAFILKIQKKGFGSLKHGISMQYLLLIYKLWAQYSQQIVEDSKKLAEGGILEKTKV